jgi:hypothetical protein
MSTVTTTVKTPMVELIAWICSYCVTLKNLQNLSVLWFPPLLIEDNKYGHLIGSDITYK